MKKTAIVLTLCLLCVALAATAVFYPADKAVADEIKIYPDDTTQYAAYGDAIAYTAENKLFISTEKGVSAGVYYDGSCMSIAMNGEYVFMLTSVSKESGVNINFKAYKYNADELTIGAPVEALSVFGVSDADITGNKFWVNANSSGLGGYDLIYSDGEKIFCMVSASEHYGETLFGNDCLFSGTYGETGWDWTPTNLDLSCATDFIAVDKDKIIFIADNAIYETEYVNYGGETGTQMMLGSIEYYSLAYLDGILFVTASDGIYKVDTTDYSSAKVSDDVFDGKIRILKGEDATYLLAQSVTDKCVKQYVINGSAYADVTLTYYNVFDGVVYQDPQTYDVLKVGKATAATNAYYSPKNLKTEFSLEEGDYVLALAKQDGFYYVRNDEGKTAYVRESELSLLEASESTAIGKYAQPLHDGTNVYTYPFVSDDVVATVNIDVMLIVVDNVAQDGDNHVWGWYKVCIVGDDGTLTYGYMQAEYASKYTNFKLPSFSTDATVSAGSLGGIINVYLLPDEESEILGTLTDGDKITLAQEKLDGNSEWTKIIYKDMVGYVKTQNLISEGITPLQITLIVVFSVVIVATAIVVVLVVKKRKAQKFDY